MVMRARPADARPAMAMLVAVIVVAACGSSGESATAHSAPSTTVPSATSAPSTASLPAPGSASQRVEAELPEARQETAAAVLEGRLYVIGGLDAGGHDSDSVFVSTGTAWSRGPRLPIAVDHPSAAVLGNRLYVGGGSTSGGATRAVFVLAASGVNWETAAPLRHARIAAALVASNSHLYAIGGYGAPGEVAAAEMFDPVSATWTDVPPPPQLRDHLSGFAYQSMACVAGGRPPTLARVDCYDAARSAWRRLPDLPTPTSGAGGAALGAVVVVAGGEDAGETHVIDQVARLRDGTWTSDAMLLPRHGFQLAVLDGRAWACGGAQLPGLHPVAVCTSIT